MYTFLDNYSNVSKLAGVLNGDNMRLVIEDLAYPMRDGVRDTRGFVETPLKNVWDTTYQAILKEKGVTFMADITAYDAYGKARSTQGFEFNEGNIPYTAAHRAISKSDYIKIMKDLDTALRVSGAASEAEKMSVVVAEMQGVIGTMSGQMLIEHDNRFAYFRNRAVSEGFIEITKENNPNEFVTPKFDFGVPTANRTVLATAAKWWTDAEFEVANENADPIGDLRKIVKAATKSKKYMKNQLEMEVEYWTLDRTIHHPKVLLHIGTAMNPAYAASTKVTNEDIMGLTYGMSDEALVDALSRAIGVEIVPCDVISSVEVLNTKTLKLEPKTMSAFKENTFVIRPKGVIGEIHSTAQLKVGGNEGADGMVTTLDGGKIMLTYKCSVESGSQQWDSGEISFPVLTASKNMFYLTVA